MKFELVKVTTSDELTLHGLLSRSDTERPMLVFLHGAASNFYNNDFVVPLATEFQKHGFGVLAVNTRGHDCLWGEAEKPDRQSGQLFELMEEAALDIDAWLEFLKAEGYSNFVLAGHSLGTQKVVRYLSEGKYPESVRQLFLLGPFDNCFVEAEENKEKLLENLQLAADAIASGRGRELCPFTPFPLSYRAFASQAADDDVCNMFDFYREDYDFPALRSVGIPIRMISGSEDEWLRAPKTKADTLARHLRDFDYSIIEGSNHDYEGYEDELVGHIVRFVHQLL